MRPYKKLTQVCGVISAISFGFCLWLHYGFNCKEADFWINVCLAVFGSALLTMLSSLVSYFHEKRATLEGFMSHCQRLLHEINKYQNSMSLEEKMEFFLNYHDLDKIAWDAAFGNIDFFFERWNGNRAYIYDKVYHPILLFNQAVNRHVWHFRWYFDGSGKNNSAMEIFISQLEGHLLYRKEQDIPTEYDKNGTPIAFCEATSIESKLVREVSQELSGRYYKIMYGNSTARSKRNNK